MAKKKEEKNNTFLPDSLGSWAEFCPLGGILYKKDRGQVLVVNFEKNPGTKILFCEHGLKCFSPFRGTNSRTLL